MRRPKFFLLAGVACALGHAAYAGDLRYQVSFTPSGDKTLDALLTQTSQLVSLNQKQAVAPFALIGRAQADQAQFLIVLHSLGYDSGSVAITIDGLVPTDPDLLDKLQKQRQSAPARLVVTPHPGPRFLLGEVSFLGLPRGLRLAGLPRSGEPALAAPILAASPALTTALHNGGYAFASVSAPQAVADLKTHRLDVTYRITAGARETIGAISFSGLTRTSAAFLRAHIALKPGQPFSDTAIDNARGALLSLGVFSSVSAVPASAAKDGEVPVIFRVTPQKRHVVTASIAYATDQGFTLGTSWEDRDVFGHAETLTITASATGIGGTGSTAPGYDIKADFAKPDYLRHGQSLNLSLEALQQDLTAYNRQAILAGASLTRPVGTHVSLTYGPSLEDETVQQQGISRSYLLLQLPATLGYSTANSVLEPTSGGAASLSLTPTEPLTGGGHPFLIIQAQGAVYLRVEPDARGIVAVHGQAGSIQGATQFEVPADQRFYAGGSGSVRGYTYQTIGPLFPDDTPEGGLATDIVNFEFRQRIGKSFGLVPFVDAGQVSAGSAPFQGTLRVGLGLGVRYYTSIGPIRVDVAFPMTRVAGSGGFALYVGLGEAF